MYGRMRTIATLLFLIALVPALAQASKGRLVGKIVDPDGKPLQGVTVTATSPDIPDFKRIETTDRKGVFVIDFTKIGVTYHYRFDKTGYDSLEANQQWTLEGSQFFDWTLHPAAVQVVFPGDSPVITATSTSAPAVEAFNTGLAALKAKDKATAEAKFKEAVEHDPNLTPGWAALSALSLELGHDESAAAAAEKAIALGSTEESVLLARWQAYKNLKDDVRAAEALKDLERIGRRTEEAKKLHNEGVALVKAGDHAGAFAKFQEALTLDPNLQVSLLGLATAGAKIGRNAEAIAAVETILKADPKNEAAIRIRYNAALALGDKAKAHRRACQHHPVRAHGRTRRPRAARLRGVRRQRPPDRPRKVRQGSRDRAGLPASLLLHRRHRCGPRCQRGGEEVPRAFPAARAERSRGRLGPRDAQVPEELRRPRGEDGSMTASGSRGE